MKKIYIILTHTGTILSKIIKRYMGDEFSHVSIALDLELDEMYSFGRFHPYNPFVAGFVHEKIDDGTFKRFKNTKTKIIELEINEEQYLMVKEKIKSIEEKKEKYKFNILGLFAIGFNVKIKAKNSFYCAEFVKFLLHESNIDISLPELIRPENFNSLYKGKEIYSGLLRNYVYRKKLTVWLILLYIWNDRI